MDWTEQSVRSVRQELLAPQERMVSMAQQARQAQTAWTERLVPQVRPVLMAQLAR